MLHHTESPTGVAVTSSPGIVYVVIVFLSDVPIEKWVSAATLIFVLLQTVFLLRDRLKKHRERKAKQ